MTKQPFESENARKSFILEIVDELSDMLKSLQHPKRLEILTFMIQSEQDFKTLQEYTSLPKNALGNHLTELVTKNLVEKIDRGVYRITDDGKDYLESISTVFLNAKIREQERLERQKQRYQDIISRYTSYDLGDMKVAVPNTTKRKETEMEVEIKTIPSFTVMGMYGRGKTPSEFIPRIWEDLEKRIDEINKLILSKTTFGISYDIDKKSQEFSYIAGYKIEPGTKLPEGFTSHTFPELTYALFKCTLQTLNETWDTAGKWIKENNYIDISKSFGEYEVYPEDFEEKTNPTMYIHVPIQKK